MSKDSDVDAEEELRQYLHAFNRWFGGGGFSRHIGMTILVLGMSAPFLLGVTAIVVVGVWIAPAAASFTDRLAVFAVLFGLLTAVAVQIASVSQRMVFGLFFIRRRRDPRPKENSTVV